MPYPRFRSICAAPAALLALLLASGCGGGSADGQLFSPDTQADAGADRGRDSSVPADASAPDSDSGGCTSAQKSCNGACVPIDEPKYGCASSACEPCGAGDVCSGGKCAHSCDTGLTTCGGACANLKTDPLHCGGCDVKCPSPAGGNPACVNFQCAITCNAGHHVCGGTCADNTSVATCGSSCAPCPPPLNGTATCNGVSCGAACNAGFHACTGQCVTNSSTASCGASCTPCSPPLNATATCDGTSCDFTCFGGYHRCGGACASDTSTAQCGPSCLPCNGAPANASPICSAGQCDFVCNAGFVRAGQTCVAVPTPTLTISAGIGGKVSNTFRLDPNVSSGRLGSFDICPNGTISSTIASYQFVQIVNPTALTARISVWSSKAATVGAQDIDTIMASYLTQPTTDVQRRACVTGVNDRCTETLDPTECITEWAGLTKTDNAMVTIAPSGSVIIYVAAYYGTTSASVHSGDYILSVRTETLN